MSPSLHRPIGFKPSEISALVNEPVVARHAEEAAFLWTQRNRAVSEPHYSLKDLAALDQRVEAHVAGLRIAGDVGWNFCKANLSNQGPGEVFSLAVLAFGAGDRGRMFEALNAGCVSPMMRTGLISALGWLSQSTVSPWISRLLEAKSSLHRCIGIATSAIHRIDPGPALMSALNDVDPVLRARALRTVGELKRQSLLGAVREHLKEEDSSCQFWAAWSLTLSGERSGLDVLTSWFERDDEFTFRALQVALRALDHEESRNWISTLARNIDQIRLAVMGAGIVGDPASVPWLIRRMESPDSARLAGEAFSSITGTDLALLDLTQDPPSSEQGDESAIEDVLDLNYESNLPWPSPTRVAKWWEANAQAFVSGRRYLLGKSITPQSLADILSAGKQRQRAAAALEWGLLDPHRILFEVRARGNQQIRTLAAWTS